jgi:hypothetical protein
MRVDKNKFDCKNSPDLRQKVSKMIEKVSEHAGRVHYIGHAEKVVVEST